MNDHIIKLPDVGEGVAEAELVEWHVAVGDSVTAESVLAEVLTDKATVEIYAPTAGVVAVLHGEPGDVLAVGGPLVTLATSATAGDDSDLSTGTPPTSDGDDPSEPATPATNLAAPPPTPSVDGGTTTAPTPPPDLSVRTDAAPPPQETQSRAPLGGDRPTAAPAVRSRAKATGIHLTDVVGSGPRGQVVHADLDRLLTERTAPTSRDSAGSNRVTTEPVRGLRRKISERMTAAWTEIPHITYVDVVDATDLEALRTSLNSRGRGPKLTLLPFVTRAIVMAVAEQPRLNAHYDSAASMLSVFEAVHVGIATQTDNGLAVPVVRHAEGRSLDELATEIAHLATTTRANKATREQLTGSSITITSLGALGGIVFTPILNAPEVSIIGINKMETRPSWRNGAFVPRQMFNISASFDHRIVDGWDAAIFVQKLRSLLEVPALLFVD